MILARKDGKPPQIRAQPLLLRFGPHVDTMMTIVILSANVDRKHRN
jgi:hypothetical protein